MSLPAQADDCNAKVLSRALRAAGPSDSAAAFSALSECDPVFAMHEAKYAFDDMNPTHEGYTALVQGVKIGVTDPAVGWVDGLQSDARSHAIAALGKACADSKEVQDFFVGRAEALGESFWDQRWYKPLGNCAAKPVTDLLWNKLSKGVKGDYTLYYGVLEAYARSAGGDAIPRIQELIEGTDDPEIQSNLVASYGDAAQVGSSDGTDAEIMGAAVESILSVSESLKPKALKQARQTLLSFDAEQESDELAALFHKDRVQPKGNFLWATIVVETATCKNGKTAQRAQVAAVREPGNTWPDQLKEKVDATVRSKWTLDLAERCKGEGEVVTLVPDSPFKDQDEKKAWIDSQLKEARRDDVKRFVVVDQDKIVL